MLRVHLLGFGSHPWVVLACTSYFPFRWKWIGKCTTGVQCTYFNMQRSSCMWDQFRTSQGLNLWNVCCAIIVQLYSSFLYAPQYLLGWCELNKWFFLVFWDKISSLLPDFVFFLCSVGFMGFSVQELRISLKQQKSM